ncbi:60s acidic ribosomal protein-domain-containing protein [Ostreococcus tauri]|uniref:60s acidic ribosomal protein-domain-containing protein n=2 Tax=Ostreococcus tauri TaxID=70448 RepID=A0A1Y5I476_OSTTA|nr:60s acidic ribosomal protein-domain-containing protein [Ostreococcus tauri]
MVCTNAENKMSGDLACTYAALILHDDGQEVTADKINAVVSASGMTIEPYWAGLFAKFLESKSVGDLISNVGAGGGAPAAAGAAGAAGGDAGAAAAPAEEEEEEEAEMDFDLFD